MFPSPALLRAALRAGPAIVPGYQPAPPRAGRATGIGAPARPMMPDFSRKMRSAGLQRMLHYRRQEAHR